jgi:hypothetical protein
LVETTAGPPELVERERVGRLAAILAADVVRYSCRMGTSVEGTRAEVKAARRQLTDPGISEHRRRHQEHGLRLSDQVGRAVDAVRFAGGSSLI